MTIRFKLNLLVVLVLLVAIVVALGTWSAAEAKSASRKRAAALGDVQMLAARAQSDMLRHTGTIGKALGEIRENEPEQAQSAIRKAEADAVTVERELSQLDAFAGGSYGSADLADRVAAIDKQWSSVSRYAQESIGAESREADVVLASTVADATPTEASAEDLEGSLNGASDAVTAQFRSFQAALDDMVHEADAAATAADEHLNTVILGGLVAIVALTAVFGFSLAGSIGRELKRAEEFAFAVATGDLGAEFGKHPQDEVGSLTRSVETMKNELVRRVENLREMAGVVLVTAESVDASAKQARAAVEAIEGDSDKVAEARQAVVASVASTETLNMLAKQMTEI